MLYFGLEFIIKNLKLSPQKSLSCAESHRVEKYMYFGHQNKIIKCFILGWSKVVTDKVLITGDLSKYMINFGLFVSTLFILIFMSKVYRYTFSVHEFVMKKYQRMFKQTW